MLALLTALGGGIAIGVAAGARRTAGAFDAAVGATNGAEFGPSWGPHDLDEARARVDAIPAIRDFSQFAGFAVRLPEAPVAGLQSIGYYNDPIVVERPFVLQGRMPRSADEVFLNESTAAVAGATVGDRLLVDVIDPTSGFTEVIPVTLAVTGVGIFADEIYQDETGNKPILIFAKPFVVKYREQVVWGAAASRLAPGVKRADALAQVHAAGLVIDKDRRVDRVQAAGAIRPLTVTLWALAILAGLATVLVVSQATHRLLQRSATATRSLLATGCTRGVVAAADVATAATVSVAGAMGAIALAISISPLFPLGRARRIAELRGIDADTTVLAVGALMLAATVTIVVAAVSLRRSATVVRPGWAPSAFAAQAAAGTGVRLATGRRGLVGAVAAVGVGLASIVAAVVFTGSMDSLAAKPALSGFNWDLLGRDSFEVIDTAAVGERVGDDPDVQRITGLTFGNATVDDRPLTVSVWQAIKGSPWPTLTGGRAPQGPKEMLAGEATLAELGHQIGDTFRVNFVADGESGAESLDLDMTVVGTAVSPPVGVSASATPRLGDGLLIRYEDVEGRNLEFGGAVLFDLADGVSPETVKARFPAGDGLPDTGATRTEWFETAAPAEVVQATAATQVLRLAIVALLLGVMATVLHSLLGFVRDRRKAYAVLKALGFTPAQIRSTVLWQSGLVVGTALVVAVPFGIAAGRWLYQGFAADIGVIVHPVVPLVSLLAAVLVAVGLVQTVALVPARRARRTEASFELSSE